MSAATSTVAATISADATAPLVFVVDNKSTVVADADVRIILLACTQVLPLVATAWSKIPPRILFAKDIDSVPSEARIICIVDQYPASASDGARCGYVCAGVILQNGGDVIWAKSGATVAAALFRELANTLVDPDCNLWWKVSDNLSYAAEVTGPVYGQIIGVLLNHGNPGYTDASVFEKKAEGGGSASSPVRPYLLTPSDEQCSGCPPQATPMNGGSPLVIVGLSDFVYPSWRDSDAMANSRLSQSGLVQHPFQVSEKGSIVILTDGDGGSLGIIHGKKVPIWIQNSPEQSARLNARSATMR